MVRVVSIVLNTNKVGLSVIMKAKKEKVTVNGSGRSLEYRQKILPRKLKGRAVS